MLWVCILHWACCERGRRETGRNIKKSRGQGEDGGKGGRRERGRKGKKDKKERGKKKKEKKQKSEGK